MSNDLTVSQVCEQTSLSRTSIWRLISNGKIGAYRIGRSVRVPRKELDKFREKHAVIPRTHHA